MQTLSAPFHKTDAKHRAHSWSRNLQKTPLTMLALPRLLGGPYSIVPVSDASLLPIKLNGRTFTAQAGSHSHPISFISILSIQPSFPPITISIHKSPQLGNVVQNLLQIPIGDFVRQAGYQSLGLFGALATQTRCNRAPRTGIRQPFSSLLLVVWKKWIYMR